MSQHAFSQLFTAKRLVLAAFTAFAIQGVAMAQTAPLSHNVLTLSAEGSVEAKQDYLTVTLSKNAVGTNAQAVQKELQEAVESALQKVRPEVTGSKLTVQTGNFSVYPRYEGKDNKVQRWAGSAEVIVKGDDFPKVLAAVSAVTSMTIANVDYSLKPETLASVQKDAQLAAVKNFGEQAQTLVTAFGFKSYAIREVAVGSNGGSYRPPMLMMAAASRSMAMDESAPLDLEAGHVNVVVSVNGSVQMQP